MAVYAPIYKDTIYTHQGEELFFRIESPQGNVLVEGEASTRPDGTAPLVYMNRLCEPFLSMEIDPVNTGLTSQSGATRTFWLYNDLNDVIIETYTFLRSYSGEWNNTDKMLSDPVRPSISKEMVVPFTAYSRYNTQTMIKGQTI